MVIYNISNNVLHQTVADLPAELKQKHGTAETVICEKDKQHVY